MALEKLDCLKQSSFQRSAWIEVKLLSKTSHPPQRATQHDGLKPSSSSADQKDGRTSRTVMPTLSRAFI
jgi:hypothetical protein